MKCTPKIRIKNLILRGTFCIFESIFSKEKRNNIQHKTNKNFLIKCKINLIFYIRTNIIDVKLTLLKLKGA